METATPPVTEEEGFAMIPLVLLRPGQRGVVGEVVGSGGVVHRLRELGLRSGVEVQMVRAGSPCIIRLGGQKLCVRSDEMSGVLVRAEAAVAC
jgi:ferrous iron transport protein A